MHGGFPPVDIAALHLCVGFLAAGAGASLSSSPRARLTEVGTEGRAGAAESGSESVMLMMVSSRT